MRLNPWGERKRVLGSLLATPKLVSRVWRRDETQPAVVWSPLVASINVVRSCGNFARRIPRMPLSLSLSRLSHHNFALCSFRLSRSLVSRPPSRWAKLHFCPPPSPRTQYVCVRMWGGWTVGERRSGAPTKRYNQLGKIHIYLIVSLYLFSAEPI